MTLLSGLANQNIDSISSVTQDRYGDDTETVEFVNVPCRWQQSMQRIVDSEAEDIVSNVQVWVFPDYEDIDNGWKLTKGTKTYTVAQKESRYDLAGKLDHVKLFLV